MANGPVPTRPCRAYQSGLLGQSSSGQGEACHSPQRSIANILIKRGQPDKKSPTRPVLYDRPMERAGPGLQGVDRVGPFATSSSILPCTLWYITMNLNNSVDVGKYCPQSTETICFSNVFGSIHVLTFATNN